MQIQRYRALGKQPAHEMRKAWTKAHQIQLIPGSFVDGHASASCLWAGQGTDLEFMAAPTGHASYFLFSAYSTLDVLIPAWIGDWLSPSFRQEDMPPEWTPRRDQRGPSMPDPEGAIICVPCAHAVVEHNFHPSCCQFTYITYIVEGTRQSSSVCGRCKMNGSTCFQFHVVERGIPRTRLWIYWAYWSNFESGLFPEADAARDILRNWLGMLQVPIRTRGCYQCAEAEEESPLRGIRLVGGGLLLTTLMVFG
ncbi:hypothetical protein N7486_000336 [Penicillium sp. IBT 16267x]|nr:hypothetical protein N7486_000336 [Penicillium sp. IBT 16267x]